MQDDISGDSVRSKRKKWHFSVEKDFILNTDLHPMARMLYMVFMSFASPDSPRPFPGMKFLANTLGCTMDTVRKYRYELEQKGWLEVEHRRTGECKFERNVYTLLDGPETMHKKPDTVFSRDGLKPTRKLSDSKSTQDEVRAEPQKTKEQNQEQGITGCAEGAPEAAAAGRSSLAGADAPAPPEGVEGVDWTDANSAPDLKASRFLKGFREWAVHAGIPTAVTDRDKQAVLKFFQENEGFRVRELLSILLAAWLMDPEAVDPDRPDRKKFWFCAKKGRRVLTFMKHLTEIQDEIGWKAKEDQIQKVLRMANMRFAVNKQKVQ